MPCCTVASTILLKNVFTSSGGVPGKGSSASEISACLISAKAMASHLLFAAEVTAICFTVSEEREKCLC